MDQRGESKEPSVPVLRPKMPEVRHERSPIPVLASNFS